MFSLEENASLAAKEYLDRLEAFYSKKESGSEVMEGIEERMAELLIEKSGVGGVVTLAAVNDVISVLGRPEAIEEESSGAQDAESAEPSGSQSPASSGTAAKPRRRLYRDPANGKLAGVCSGLGAYLDIDPAIFRILFVILTLLGFGFVPNKACSVSVPLIYFMLWICMPAVKTVRQRDELRGEGGTVDDISARVRNSGRKGSGARDPQTWKNFCRIFSVIFGAILLLAGVAGMAFLSSFWWGGEIFGNAFFYNKFIEDLSFGAPSEILAFFSSPLVVLGAVLVASIPLFIMIYEGVMLIFGLKSPKWHPALTLFVVWMIILVVLLVSSFLALSVRI